MGPQSPPPFPWSSSSTDCSWCLSDCIIGSNRGQLKCEMKDKVFKGSVQWKKNRMSKNRKGSRILQEDVEEQSSLFFKHRQAKTRGDLLGNALMNFTHLFDKMLFFLWAFYPIITIVSNVNIQLWFDIVWYYVILVMCLWISPQFLERVSVNEYEQMFANIQASCSIIFSLQNNNNNNKFEKGHQITLQKN